MPGQRISVAMATYNGERFLQRQLDSLARQTLLPAELAVCDDRSTDATAAILRTFAARAPFPVRLRVNPANLGWRANFMQATSLCREPLIAFCDQDDVWYPTKLSRMASLFEDPTTLLGYHDADVIDEAGSIVGIMREGKNDPLRQPALTRPIHWESPFGLTVVFHRSLLALSHLWPMTVDPSDASKPAAHDRWFVFLASCFGEIRFSPDRLLGYRQHGDNVIGFGGAGPSVVDKVSGQIDMIASFCRVLEATLDEPSCVHQSRVLEALVTSHRLQHRLVLRRQLRDGSPLTQRVAAFSRLLKKGAYSPRQSWNFGYRNVVVDLRAVLSGA